jgi:hypothetical protein
MTNKIVAGLIGILLLGAATGAEAASCPAAPPVQIAFEAPSSPLAQDTSLSAKEVAAKRGGEGLSPAFYDAGIVTSSRRDNALAKLPDGTVCAAVAKLTVKITLERKLWLASELKDDACVLNAFATQYGARSKTDEDVIAAFGKTVAERYKAEVAAIGWQKAPSQEAALKAVADKVSPIMSQIDDKLTEERTAAQTKIDLSGMPADGCDGNTEKLGHKVGVGNKKS